MQLNGDKNNWGPFAVQLNYKLFKIFIKIINGVTLFSEQFKQSKSKKEKSKF